MTGFTCVGTYSIAGATRDAVPTLAPIAAGTAIMAGLGVGAYAVGAAAASASLTITDLLWGVGSFARGSGLWSQLLRGTAGTLRIGAAARAIPEIGRKLDYFLGRATGSLHNVQRSTQMLSQLERIGLRDTPATREYLIQHLTNVVNDPSNISRIQDNGRIVRESLLMGPLGGVKFETIWQGTTLITGNIFGGP